MRISLSTSPDLVRIMVDEIRSAERAVTQSIREAGNALKSAWRGQIVRAGLGVRLANSIRSQVYPEGRDSIRAAAMVWSRAPHIISAHEQGAVIRSRRGFWLAVPLPAAGKSIRGGRITPAEWERRTGLRLRLIYRRGKPGLLVAESRLNSRGRAVASRSRQMRWLATVPIFLLLPQVTLRRRLDLAAEVDRVVAALPGAIVDRWREAA